MVRQHGGRWRCNNCGEYIDGAPLDRVPTITIRVSAGRPTVRRIFVDDAEVHSCEVRYPRPPPVAGA